MSVHKYACTVLIICVSYPTDDPLAVQIFQNQLYSNPTSTVFIDKIIDRQCEIDIGALLRNTQHYESFYEIRNVNHSLTSTYVAKREL